MIRSTIRLLPALLVLTLASACEPISMLPGATLSGEAHATPADWAGANDAEVIQLETRPADPYSVNIWATGIGTDLYVATGSEGTSWTGYIEKDPAVRVRIDGALYELTAKVVEDRDERDRVAAAYVEKYGLDPDDNWVDTGMVIRLDRR